MFVEPSIEIGMLDETTQCISVYETTVQEWCEPDRGLPEYFSLDHLVTAR